MKKKKRTNFKLAFKINNANRVNCCEAKLNMQFNFPYTYTHTHKANN